MDIFSLTTCEYNKNLGLKDISNLSIDLFEKNLMNITNFSVAYKNERGKDICKSYKYSRKRFAQFENIDLEKISSIVFVSLPKKGNWPYDSQFEVNYLLLPKGTFISIIMRKDTIMQEEIVLFSKTVKNIISKKFKIVSCQTDVMDEHKNVESFVNGFGDYINRNAVENLVAYNISMVKYNVTKIEKLPFIFFYNYYSKLSLNNNEFIFPSIFNIDFENYINDKEWRKAFEELTKEGIISFNVEIYDEMMGEPSNVRRFIKYINKVNSL